MKYSISSLLIAAILCLLPLKGNPAGGLEGTAWDAAMTSDGRIMAILRLHAPGTTLAAPDLEAGETDLAVMARTVETITSDLASRLPDISLTVARRFQHLPLLALEISPEALRLLHGDPRVAAIYPDLRMPVSDFEVRTITAESVNGAALAGNQSNSAPTPSMALIGADKLWERGLAGEGWHVAVISTGIRNTHELFRGKPLTEACFSRLGHCPDGSTAMTGPGAAAHHPAGLRGYDLGTARAGVAAGRKGNASGVARDAGVIAVNVSSRFSAQTCGGTPCVMAYISDQIAALDYVYGLRETHNIGAVDLAWIAGGHHVFCDDDPREPAMAQLRAAHIPTVVGSGVNGYCGLLPAPACVSSAVTVTDSTILDQPRPHANWHQTMVNLFAPGVNIPVATGDADRLGNARRSGMGAPHVVGALTVARQFNARATVTNNIAALAERGRSIRSACPDGKARRRIQVDNFSGELKVTLEPEDVVEAGAMWRRSGTTPWLNSGDVESGIPAGSHAVEFSAVEQWTAPDPVSVFISSARTEISASYEAIPPQIEVRATAGPGGSVSPAAQTVAQGTAAPLTLTIDPGFLRDKVDGTCPPGLFSAKTYTTGPITSPCSLSFSFSPLHSWTSELGMVNTTNAPVDATLHILDDQGRERKTCRFALPAYASRRLIAGRDDCLPDVRGHARLETDDQAVAGYALFGRPGQYRAAVPAAPANTLDTLHVPHIASNDVWSTRLDVLNTTTSRQSLTMTFNTGLSTRIDAPPGNRVAFSIRDLFSGQPRPDLSSAWLSNASGSVAMNSFSGDGRPVLATTLLTGETSRRLIFPHVAEVSQWWTGIAVHNPGPQPTALTVSCYDNMGTLLNTVAPMALAPGQRLAGMPDGFGCPGETQWLAVDSSAPVTGLVLFGDLNDSRLAGFTTVNLASRTGVLARLEQDGWSGMALVNTEPSPALLTLTAHAESGETLSQVQLSIPTLGKIIGLLQDFFPDDVGNAAVVRYVANRELASCVINGSADETMLDALPALRGSGPVQFFPVMK